ncbi:MAG: RdgB/HAM1 family non-canonical purine NTP pyrophosphatase [Alphaproteobacteria bacterium]|nr:RdgB/HAM1 family non-canonical purine NTP pyrophosphatase [Alphaproteobacteria bacterium]
MPAFQGKQLLIASANQGKIKEIKALLHPFPLEVVGLDHDGVVSPDETGKTFIDNAILKAKYYGQHAGMPALADDSGLMVEALGGAPGVQSSRWAEENGGYESAMEQLKHDISESRTGNYNAAFICALALWWPDGSEEGRVETFEGRVDGSLSFPPRGSHGFGYDPIFVADGQRVTFAEMTPEEKHAISHRARAFEKFIQGCF